MLNKNVDKLGWLIVAVLLVYDGVHHAITGKIMSKIYVGAVVTEGWQVVALGIIEALVGVYVGWHWLKKKKQ